MLGSFYPNHYYGYQPSRASYFQYQSSQRAMLIFAMQLQNYFRLGHPSFRSNIYSPDIFYQTAHQARYPWSNSYSYHPNAYYGRSSHIARNYVNPSASQPVYYTQAESDRIWQEAIAAHQNPSRDRSQSTHSTTTHRDSSERMNLSSSREELSPKFRVVFRLDEYEQHREFIRNLVRKDVRVDKYVENDSKTDIEVCFESEKEALEFMDFLKESDPDLFHAVKFNDGNQFHYFDQATANTEDLFLQQLDQEDAWKNIDSENTLVEVSVRNEKQAHQLMALNERLNTISFSKDCNRVFYLRGDNAGFKFDSPNDDDIEKLRSFVRSYSPETYELFTDSKYSPLDSFEEANLRERAITSEINELYVGYMKSPREDVEARRSFTAAIKQKFEELDEEIGVRFVGKDRRDHINDLLFFTESLEQRKNPEQFRFSGKKLPQALLTYGEDQKTNV